MTTKNWTPVVLDLLTLLTKEGGARLVRVDDHEDLVPIPAGLPPGEDCLIAAEAVCAVDSSTLRVALGDEIASLVIFLDDKPSEIVQDCVAPERSRIHWMLGTITREFFDRWEGKPCPVIKDPGPTVGPPVIDSVLVLSTLHVPGNFAFKEEWTYGQYDRGAWCSAYDEDTCNQLNVPWLWPISQYARSHGCHWIRFDCDGNIMGGLPIFPGRWT